MVGVGQCAARARASFSASAGRSIFAGAMLGLWLPWSMRFLGACEPDTIRARPRRAEWTSCAMRWRPGSVWKRWRKCRGWCDPHGQANLYMTPPPATKRARRMPHADGDTARYRDMTDAELARYEGVLKARPASGLHFDGTGQVQRSAGRARRHI